MAIGISEENSNTLYFLIVKFHIYSLIDIYGSVKRISPGAKSQMILDVLFILDNSKRYVFSSLRTLEDYALDFFNIIQYDEPSALSTLVSSLGKYPLRILKNFYLYASKDVQVRKSFSSSSIVVKTEKLVTLFELSRSCLLSLVEDQKIIDPHDFSSKLVEIILASNEKAKIISSTPKSN